MSDEKKSIDPITVKEFFEKIPPGSQLILVKVEVKERAGIKPEFILPILELHCETESCDGVRFFETENNPHCTFNELEEHFITYRCKNCEQTSKTYALFAVLKKDKTGELLKIGEYPSFGPPTPARVITLIGSEKEYYLKGRRAESQGLGIAAFAYYRRVVENQKNKILDEIIRVSKKIGASDDISDELEAAKKEIQFSKAISKIKHSIPQTLLINGHNPLTLLHSALSEGLHEHTDEQCLELATSIRVVLTEMAERLANSLKDTAELNNALSKLLNANAIKKS